MDHSVTTVASDDCLFAGLPTHRANGRAGRVRDSLTRERPHTGGSEEPPPAGDCSPYRWAWWLSQLRSPAPPRVSSAHSKRGVSKIRSNPPDCTQRRKRRSTVFQFPKSLGRSLQGAPVRVIQIIPPMTFGCCFHFSPDRLFGPAGPAQ